MQKTCRVMFSVTLFRRVAGKKGEGGEGGREEGKKEGRKGGEDGGRRERGRQGGNRIEGVTQRSNVR